MSGLSDSGRLLRGALVQFDLLKPPPVVTTFQYNPDTLNRSISQQSTSEGARATDGVRLPGAPVETIQLDVELDAADSAAAAGGVGVHPQLAAFETMLYPSSSLVIANTAALALGEVEIVPPLAPLTLFVWGARRVLPVSLGDLRIVEEAYDADLNPVRARVSLSLRVLSYNDLSVTNPGRYVFMAHQLAKETLGRMGSAASLDGVMRGNAPLLWR